MFDDSKNLGNFLSTNGLAAHQAMRLAPLGIHYGLVHQALLCGKRDWILRFAKPLIRRDDASTQWYLGLMYHAGDRFTRDWETARLWYEQSAAQGFGAANDGLIALAASETGMVLDPNRLSAPSMAEAYADITKLKCSARDTDALFWDFQKLADLGDTEIQILLGVCYQFGIHVPSRLDFALEWYRRAAIQGNHIGLKRYKSLSHSRLGWHGHEARLELAFVFEMAADSILKGPEPANEFDAIRWYLDAARKGDRYAAWRVSELYERRSGTEQDNTDWACYVAERGNSPAHNRYWSFLIHTPKLKLADSRITLLERRRLRVAMAQPIASALSNSSDAVGLACNDN